MEYPPGAAAICLESTNMTRFQDVDDLLGLTAEECGALVACLGSGYVSYRAMFEQDGIDGVFLDGLSEEEMGATLREIGVEKALHIKNIYKHFMRLYSSAAVGARNGTRRTTSAGHVPKIPLRKPSPQSDVDDLDNDDDDEEEEDGLGEVVDRFEVVGTSNTASVASTTRPLSARRPSMMSGDSRGSSGASTMMNHARTAASKASKNSRRMVLDALTRNSDTNSRGSRGSGEERSGADRSAASDTTGSSTDAVYRDALERVRTAVETAQEVGSMDAFGALCEPNNRHVRSSVCGFLCRCPSACPSAHVTSWRSC